MGNTDKNHYFLANYFKMILFKKSWTCSTFITFKWEVSLKFDRHFCFHWHQNMKPSFLFKQPVKYENRNIKLQLSKWLVFNRYYGKIKNWINWRFYRWFKRGEKFVVYGIYMLPILQWKKRKNVEVLMEKFDMTA